MSSVIYKDTATVQEDCSVICADFFKRKIIGFEGLPVKYMHVFEKEI